MANVTGIQTREKKVYVIGVGMTKFCRPGSGKDYPEFAKEAVANALQDSGVPYQDVQAAVAGYCYGDPTCGQRAVYENGLTGIPVCNVNNNCSTGSTALFMANNLVQGAYDCVLALGFEKMERHLTQKYDDREPPTKKHFDEMYKLGATPGAIREDMNDFTSDVIKLFAYAARDHMDKYGTTREQFAKISHKNHKHSVNNPYSQFRDEYTLEQIEKSPPVFGPLTKLQCCPTSDGAGAAIVCSEAFVKKYGLENQAVEVMSMKMTTDTKSTFGKSCMAIAGADMTRSAAKQVYKEAGINADQVDVVELHDCFSANELITYEALQLCGEGEAGKYIDAGNNTYGGKHVVNPSGGLISKGHPLGATGLAQCAELCWQLRGLAEKRQVPNAKIALQHNLGLGGAAVVALYKKYNSNPDNKPGHTSNPDVLEQLEQAVLGAAKTLHVSTGEMHSKQIFDEMKAFVAGNGPALVKKVNAVFAFDISGNGTRETFIVDLKNGNGLVEVGSSGSPADCRFVMKDQDFKDIYDGKLQPQAAFMKGKMKVQGNMGIAQKFNPSLFKAQAKM
eukprot:GFYU01003057.1.p1 GENE.GFYU01003057.1~~GFYU01003057.1.p1  ORF type:complete len:562 (-),score=217.15 GFYU01003057.1:81-1766(-)